MSANNRQQMSLLEPVLWRDPACWQGMKDMAVVTPGFMAWGLVTGVAMVKGGLPLSIALLMALTVFAASAQLAALPLMMAGAPLWVIWATALCVNLRFVIFSAQMRHHMMALRLPWRVFAGYLTADLTYVLMQHQHGQTPAASRSNPGPLAYFCGMAVVNWAAWNVAILTGVLFASAVPTEWGLGFAGTLALLGLLVSLARDWRTALCALLAAVVAVATYTLPFKLYIFVALVATVAAGLLLEKIPMRAKEPS